MRRTVLLLLMLTVACGARTSILTPPPPDDAGRDAAPDVTDAREEPPPSDGGSDVVEASCTEGRVVLASGQTWGSQVGSLVVSNGYAYWDTGTSIMRVPVCGGTPELVQSRALGPFALSGDSLYWAGAEGDGGAILGSPNSGGPSTTLVPEGALPALMAVNDSVVAWGTQGCRDCDALVVVPRAGGAPRALLKYQEFFGVVLDATAAYAVDGPTLLKVPLGGGTYTTLAATNTPGSGSLGVYAGDVYWVKVQVDVTAPSSFSYAIVRFPIGGGSATTLVSPSSAWIGGLAVDGKDLYWVAAVGTDVDLYRAPNQAGATATKIPDTRGAMALAIDDTSLYWTTFDGLVVKLSPK